MCLCGDPSTSQHTGKAGSESAPCGQQRVPPEVLERHFKHLPLLIYIAIKVLVANFVTNSLV